MFSYRPAAPAGPRADGSPHRPFPSLSGSSAFQVAKSPRASANTPKVSPPSPLVTGVSASNPAPGNQGATSGSSIYSFVFPGSRPKQSSGGLPGLGSSVPVSRGVVTASPSFYQCSLLAAGSLVAASSSFLLSSATSSATSSSTTAHSASTPVSLSTSSSFHASPIASLAPFNATSPQLTSFPSFSARPDSLSLPLSPTACLSPLALPLSSPRRPTSAAFPTVYPSPPARRNKTFTFSGNSPRHSPEAIPSPSPPLALRVPSTERKEEESKREDRETWVVGSRNQGDKPEASGKPGNKAADDQDLRGEIVGCGL